MPPLEARLWFAKQIVEFNGPCDPLLECLLSIVID